MPVREEVSRLSAVRKAAWFWAGYPVPEYGIIACSLFIYKIQINEAKQSRKVIVNICNGGITAGFRMPERKALFGASEKGVVCIFCCGEKTAGF